MPTINERVLRQRHRERLRAIGTAIRHLREDAGRSQAVIARAAGVSTGHLCEIEAGDAEPSLLILERIGMALGADLGVRYFANTGPAIRDHIQVAMTEALLAGLHPRWSPMPEVPVYRPVHGVIDVVLSDRSGATDVATELQSQLRRVEQQVRWQAQKADASAALPRSQGRNVSRLLVVRNTRTMREVVRSAAATLAAAYPATAEDALGAIRDGASWPGAAIVWMDVRAGAARLLDGAPRGILVRRRRPPRLAGGPAAT